ncbi:uncharacterized protein LOC113161708 [Anabas testudineus]|uniref:uncharacterized protein LOC113161708 n=1 Tax=Anabas testudineus TaxID=64144 RepID=UPI000E457640|nr:uncharacterized protein LOC113161708 [Anabas testudineus]
MDAGKQTDSEQTEFVRARSSRAASKRLSDQKRSKTRVNIGGAFKTWRRLRARHDFKNDAEVANFLLNSYLRTKSESRPEPQSLERSSSTETCESVHYEFPIMSSPNETEPDNDAAPSLHSSDDGRESGSTSQDEWTTKQMENKENADDPEGEDEEFSTSLSVGDGRYLVDLGSPSEFVVDEECIIQLFKSCRECNRQCTVRKRVKGLKLVVYQTCCFCQSHCKWTNLPDDKEDSDFQVNGKDTSHGETNAAVSPNSNTS